RLSGRLPLADRDLPLPILGREFLELLLGRFGFFPPPFSVRSGLLSPLSGSLQIARIDPVQDRLGDELLHLVGVDVRLAAPGESLPFGAGVAALSAGARSGNQPLAAAATDKG